MPPEIRPAPQRRRDEGLLHKVWTQTRFSERILGRLRYFQDRFHDNTGSQPSTAAVLRRNLEAMGISPNVINRVHVSEAYARMNDLPSAPDFEAITPILSSLRQAEPTERDLTGFIIETRRHANIKPVLENFLDRVDMSVQFFHGTENEEYLKYEIPASLRSRVKLVKLPTATLSAKTYNALLLSEPFWYALEGRQKILCFQTDTLTCEASDFNIGDFMDFDYIGSLWPRNRPHGIIEDGGNGGLSLRDWSASVDCLRRFPPADWKGGEDDFFAFHMDLAGYRIGRSDDCAKFSTEYFYRERSWGAHKITKMSRFKRDLFFRYCPEARILE